VPAESPPDATLPRERRLDGLVELDRVHVRGAGRAPVFSVGTDPRPALVRALDDPHELVFAQEAQFGQPDRCVVVVGSVLVEIESPIGPRPEADGRF
jgi:hypothetical protein